MNTRIKLALALLFSTAIAPAAFPQDGPATRPATQPDKSQFDREMTVSPAKAEDAVPPGERADPFAFSQDALELRNENAATLYLQGFPMVSKRYGDKIEALEALENQPIHELDRAAAQEMMGSTGVEISEPSVRRTFADWGSPIQELGVETLLPYLSDCRLLARALALKARLLALEGKHKEAAETLRRVYVLAQHVGDARQPVLIDGLVGVAIASMATDRAAQIAQLEDAPNRYWALTTLPSPMFDIGHWMRAERVFPTVSLPALREPERITSDQWFNTLRTLRTFMTDPDENTSSIKQLLEDAAATASMAQQAESYLKARGYTDEQLEAMGMHAIIATWMMDDYRSRFDAMSKLVYLPFPQALPLLFEQEKRMVEDGPGVGPGLLADILLPSISRAVAAPYRLERQIAALRIVEAVRDHAAHHEGALPKSLDEMRLPIPEDPMTGESFGYAMSGDTFTITARRYNEGDINSGFVWRVTMRR